MKNAIHFVDKNIHGAWVIYGILGIRQYYGYSKKEAIRLYKNECESTIIEAKVR